MRKIFLALLANFLLALTLIAGQDVFIEIADLGFVKLDSEIAANYNYQLTVYYVSGQERFLVFHFEHVYDKKLKQLYEFKTERKVDVYILEASFWKIWDLDKKEVLTIKKQNSDAKFILTTQDVPIPAIDTFSAQASTNLMYQIFIRSFYDSNADGVGDFKGILEKLGYLKSLSVDAVLFSPWNLSSSYHGYDAVDFYTVNPEFGNFEDLLQMIQSFKTNGIRVVMDLMINHTSDQHIWFKDAIENTVESPYWEYYLISFEDMSSKKRWYSTKNTKDEEIWYFSLFGKGFADLNFDNPMVRLQIKRVINFWLGMGVDGFRVDAIKNIYGFDWNDGIVESARYAKELTEYILQRKPNVLLIGEVFDANIYVLQQFAPMPLFNFAQAFSFRNNFIGADNLLSKSLGWLDAKLYPDFKIYNFPFLDNHDMDRIYSVIEGFYKSNKELAKLQYGLLYALVLAMDGMPTIYYGNELAMRGLKWSEPVYDLTVREPMQWYANMKENGDFKLGYAYWTQRYYEKFGITESSASSDGAIFDDAYDGVSVEEQENVNGSFLEFFKALAGLRKKFSSIAFGNLEILKDSKNFYVLRRKYEDEEIVYMLNMHFKNVNQYTFESEYTCVFFAEPRKNGETFYFHYENPNWSVKIGEVVQIGPRQIYVFKRMK